MRVATEGPYASLGEKEGKSKYIQLTKGGLEPPKTPPLAMPLYSIEYTQASAKSYIYSYRQLLSDEHTDEQSDLDPSLVPDAVEAKLVSGTIEPYQYEPIASDASSGSDGDTEDVDSDDVYKERSRLSNTDWLVVINTPHSLI